MRRDLRSGFAAPGAGHGGRLGMAALLPGRAVMFEGSGGRRRRGVDIFLLVAGISRQAAFDDLNRNAFRHMVEEIDHIHAPHPDTAKTGGTSDGGFFRRAMDIDEAAVGVAGLTLRALGHWAGALHRSAAGS